MLICENHVKTLGTISKKDELIAAEELMSKARALIQSAGALMDSCSYPRPSHNVPVKGLLVSFPSPTKHVEFRSPQDRDIVMAIGMLDCKIENS